MSAQNSDLAALLGMQRAAMARVPCPDLAIRREDLKRLRCAVLRYAARFIDAIKQDFGHRSETETVMSDIAPVIGAIDYAVRCLPRWMRRERKSVPMMFQPGRAWVEWRPAGCVGIIGAWNFPLLLCLSPLVDALAAGNRAMVKPSELTPRFAALLAEMMCGVFPAEQVAVVQGDAAVSAAFCKLKFDHLLFTGSARVGRMVMLAAAENLTPVTLELGGKCPAIICPDYDPIKAVPAIAVGKFLNAGQVCLAPDYVLVAKDKVASIGHALFAHVGKMFPFVAGNDDYTAILGGGALDRLVSALAEAEASGCIVLRGADALSENRIAPTIVLDPPLDGALMRDEIFGPVLPVIGYEDFADAMRIVARYPDPLAVYPFTDDADHVRQLIDRVPTGGMSWNGTILHGALPGLPFGGAGRSGMGRYHGRAGFERFSRQISVYKPGFFSGFTAMSPPHGLLARAVRWAVLRS